VTVLGIIPARHASTRFPGKPLVVLAGKPMLQWVWERARLAREADEVIVATDDERVRDCATSFGAHVAMTSASCATGTDRIAEIAARSARAGDGDAADVYVNIQGDEPLIEPEAIDACVRALRRDAGASMATLCAPLREGDYENENVVKVVTRTDGRALYFSRAPIPWLRGRRAGDAAPGPARRHVGLYAYRRDALLRLASMPPSPLERCESLEQLRALDAGMAIAVAEGPDSGPAVDVPSDVPAAEEALLRLLAARR
jgi:3-deoxy-D-manno-octulosonate cytidylyltransferase